MAETSGLLNRRTGNSRTEGSNPSVSASTKGSSGGRSLGDVAEGFTASLAKRLRTDPPARKGHRTRERFKLATAQVLEKVGFHAMRVSDVTDAANSSEGTFYIYFRDKRDAKFQGR